jgi:hypothetical protein
MPRRCADAWPKRLIVDFAWLTVVVAFPALTGFIFELDERPQCVIRLRGLERHHRMLVRRKCFQSLACNSLALLNASVDLDEY